MAALYSIIALTLLCLHGAEMAMYDEMFQTETKYSLPELPYKYNALEPYLDKKTVTIHHTKHHKKYTDKMNAALKEWRKTEPENPLANTSIFNILQNIDEVPERWRTTLRNNGGGYVNHNFYWATMCPKPKRIPPPLTEAMESGDPTPKRIDDFLEDFHKSAETLFGSGFAWMVLNKTNNKLSVVTTKDQDCPLSSGLFPILALDVWEHAYYLKYKNDRSQYIEEWWAIACWQEVEKLRQFWMNYTPTPDQPVMPPSDQPSDTPPSEQPSDTPPSEQPSDPPSSDRANDEL